ncbi:MAG: molecular chaperone DnaJ [Armatimonadota bacterium]|nr:molecular chaperone DnaJ [Armatimonadota bacterium]MDR7591381.1 molecular chaperone DnaJ [Armatimonadota bacterium]
MAKDYYATLGIRRDASQEEIKQAYRRLAREYHPDVRRDDPQANERFKEINEAYAVLSDPARRAQYDRFGRVDEVPAVDPTDLFGSFDDLFDMFFGGGPRRTRTRVRPVEEEEAVAGADLRAEVEVTLEEAASGVERTLTLTRLETCPVCFGTGREPNTSVETCPTCAGTGQVRYHHQTVFGYLTQVVTCRQCGGRGRVVRHPCRACGGAGRREAERQVTVRIPPGVETGTRLRVPEEGEAGVRGGPRGDLYVVVRVLPHPRFTRQGRDLICEVPVSMLQAALGDEIEIPALGETLRIAIPPGTQPGATLRLRGQGMPDLQGGRGDLYVRLRVEIPRDLTPEQRRLLKQVADLRGERVQPQRPSLWKKMKDLFTA